MTTPTCARCGQTLTRRKQRRYCGIDCSSAAAAERRANLIEDVTYLLEAGVTPAEIAPRIGRTASAIEQALYRAKQPDLARLFSRPRYDDRRHPCIDCGAPGVWSSAKRCRPCGYRAREAARKGAAA